MEIKANLSEDDLKTLLDLAELRGIDANTVLQQAIATEKLISENVGKDDELLIKKGNTISKVKFSES